jgi:hypothetical protein
MSNLSELLPAGGAGKNVSFVASGTLPNGQAVVLKADGTVEAVVQTSVTESIPAGAQSTFNAAISSFIQVAFDPSTPGKFVVAYRGANGTATPEWGFVAAGTVSGTSISFGTPVLFSSAGTTQIVVAYDPDSAGKFVVAYDAGSVCKTIVGTVSGTSVTVGSEYAATSTWGSYKGISFIPNTPHKFILSFSKGSAGDGTIVIGTVSGTSISYGSESVFHSGGTTWTAVDFNPNVVNTFVVAYNDPGNSDYGTCAVGTISGTSISYGSHYVFNTSGSTSLHINFDHAAGNKFVLTYEDAGNSAYGTAIVGTVSGTAISYGSEYVFNSAATKYPNLQFDPNTLGKFVIGYIDDGNSAPVKVIVGSISGTALSYASPISIGSNGSNYVSVDFNKAQAGQFVVAYRNPDGGHNGAARLGQIASSPTNLTATNFIGMADAAIADTAAGSVTIKGGLAKSVSNVAATTTFAAVTEFFSGQPEFMEMAFDPNNANKLVICFRDGAGGNNGKAMVGTVSGTSISFGNAVTFGGETLRPSLAWDPDNSGKLVIAYKDSGNSGQGTAIVGTVSGTSISFGSEVVFCTGETQQTAITFNSSNTYVITYRNEGNSNYGEGIVGTVSGTSISFGTASVFNSASTATNQVAADPNTANTVVVAYSNGATNPATGGAAVGTVSGTSISWGSEQQFASTETAWVRMAFDPNNAGKFVIMWRDGAGSDGATIVGNVSGTSITYGAKTLFLAGANQSADNIAFDTNKANSIILSYNKSGGKVVEGTITGNSIAYGTTFSYANTTGHNWVAIDPSAAGKFALAYQDGSDSGKGKVIMGQSSEALTTGSDYYLQSDGSVSTATASPAINIGRAISPTSLILR